MDRSQEGLFGGADGSSNRPDRHAGAGEPRQISAARPRLLQPWKVVLHDDQVNEQDYVVRTLHALTPLNEYESYQRMTEAEKLGSSLLLLTHRERAELYQLQLGKRNLTVTIEPGS